MAVQSNDRREHEEFHDTHSVQEGSSDPDPYGVPLPPQRSHLLLTIVAIVAVAGCFGLASQTYIEWRTRAADEPDVQAVEQAKLRAQQRALLAQREAATRQAQQQARHQQQEAARIEAIEQRQQDDNAVKQAARAEADRKAKAWANFYHKPTSCNDPGSMACVNSYIRAKRLFEEKYAHGEL